jgi:hypothetical protein
MTKKFEPTAEQRRLVSKLAGIRCSQKEIIDIIDWGPGRKIDLKTLRARFRDELDQGASFVNMSLRRKLYDEAMSGNTAALIFSCKSWLGMSETMKIEQSGPDGAPLPQPAQVVFLPVKDPPPDRFGSVIESPAPRPLPAVDSIDPVLSAIEFDGTKQDVGAMRPGTMFPQGADLRR